MLRLSWPLMLALTLTLVTASHVKQRRAAMTEGDGAPGDADGDRTQPDAARIQPRFAHLQTPTEDDDDDADDADGGSVDAGAHGSDSLGGASTHRRRHDHSAPGAPGGSRGSRNRNSRRGQRGQQAGGRGRGAAQQQGAGRGADAEGADDEEGAEGTLYEDDAPGGCPRCQEELHEEYKRLRLEAIKAEILSRLNLKEAPKVSNKTLPQNPTVTSLIDRFEMAGDAPYEYDGGRSAYDEDDTYHVKPLEILLMATTPPANKTINETNVCYFALNSDVMDAKTIKAEFGVFLKRSRAPTARPTLLIISKLEKRQVGIIKKTVQTRQLTLDTESTGRWYRFSTDRIVKDWVQNPNKNLGLQVEAYDYDGTQLAIVQTDNEREEPYKPYLQVLVKGSSRPKRHLPAPDCTAQSKERRCCRYPLIVDFVAMKWDWILAPKQYKAYYCYGKCPFAYYRPYPHTHVVTQTLVSDFTPCCTASELKQLLLFYRNQEQTIIYGRIPGMIVEACSCI